MLHVPTECLPDTTSHWLDHVITKTLSQNSQEKCNAVFTSKCTRSSLAAGPTEVCYISPPHPVVAMDCGEGRDKGIGRNGKEERVREGKEKSGGKEGGEGEGIKALPPRPQ